MSPALQCGIKIRGVPAGGAGQEAGAHLAAALIRFVFFVSLW